MVRIVGTNTGRERLPVPHEENSRYKGEKSPNLSPLPVGGGERGALYSPNTKSWGGVCLSEGWSLPQATPCITPPGLLQVLGFPRERALAAA